MKRHFAFSLIELMVVIAIVAILAAIAVPAYKGHMRKSVINANSAIFDTVANQAIKYYETHGAFPSTMQQIGLNSPNASYPETQPNLATATNTSGFGFPPHLAFIFFSVGGGVNCPTINVGGYFANTPNVPIGTGFMHVIRAYKLSGSGTWKMVCGGTEQVLGITETGAGIYPGCYNFGNTSEMSAYNADIATIEATCS